MEIVFALGAIFFMTSALRLGAPLLRLTISFKRALVLALFLGPPIWLMGSGLLVLNNLLPPPINEIGFIAVAVLIFLSGTMVLRRKLQAPWWKGLALWILLVGIQVGWAIMLLGGLEGNGALAKAKQRKTVADIRNTGNALLSWLTDYTAEAEAPEAQAAEPSTQVDDGKTREEKIFDVTEIPVISYQDVVKLLRPTEDFFYMQEVPEHDGWGHALEFRVDLTEPLGRWALCIRSPGKNGKFETDRYRVAPFDPIAYDEDIVWTDGVLIRWPESLRR